MSSFSRDILNALLPEGQFWTPADGDDYDNLLEGIATNFETVRLAMKALGSLRDPAKTSILSDLEKEFGIIFPIESTEAERRQILKSFMFKRAGLGAYDILQEKLNEAGFDVLVIPNSPPIDPSIYYDAEYAIEGELLVNKLEYDTSFSVPINPGYWPLFFFIGDAVHRDEYGNILSIDYINILEGKRQALKQIILKYKPTHSWGVLVETKTQYLDGIRYLDGTWWLNGFGRDV